MCANGSVIWPKSLWVIVGLPKFSDLKISYCFKPFLRTWRFQISDFRPREHVLLTPFIEPEVFRRLRTAALSVFSVATSGVMRSRTERLIWIGKIGDIESIITCAKWLDGGVFWSSIKSEGLDALHLMVIYKTCQNYLAGLLSESGHSNGYYLV